VICDSGRLQSARRARVPRPHAGGITGPSLAELPAASMRRSERAGTPEQLRQGGAERARTVAGCVRPGQQANHDNGPGSTARSRPRPG
jgi:hypothetical protein